MVGHCQASLPILEEMSKGQPEVFLRQGRGPWQPKGQGRALDSESKAWVCVQLLHHQQHNSDQSVPLPLWAAVLSHCLSWAGAEEGPASLFSPTACF